MKRAFKNQRQPGSAVISAEGSRGLCIGTCSLAPPTTCPTLMTRERRAYGPTRASSDVPETGDDGGQSWSGARRGGRGTRSLLGRIKVRNNCNSCVWRRSALDSGHSFLRPLTAVDKRLRRHRMSLFLHETHRTPANAVISKGSVVTSHFKEQLFFQIKAIVLLLNMATMTQSYSSDTTSCITSFANDRNHKIQNIGKGVSIKC